MSQDQPSLSETLHATSVCIGERGVLLLGKSGSGKSDLALRLIDDGAALISDDYTLATAHDGKLLLRAPDNISGKMEIRYLGLVEMAHRNDVRATLAIRLDEKPERMPENIPTIMVAGIALPLVTLNAFEASAPVKVKWAIRLHCND